MDPFAELCPVFVVVRIYGLLMMVRHDGFLKENPAGNHAHRAREARRTIEKGKETRLFGRVSV